MTTRNGRVEVTSERSEERRTLDVVARASERDHRWIRSRRAERMEHVVHLGKAMIVISKSVESCDEDPLGTADCREGKCVRSREKSWNVQRRGVASEGL